SPSGCTPPTARWPAGTATPAAPCSRSPWTSPPSPATPAPSSAAPGPEPPGLIRLGAAGRPDPPGAAGTTRVAPAVTSATLNSLFLQVLFVEISQCREGMHCDLRDRPAVRGREGPRVRRGVPRRLHLRGSAVAVH